MGDPPWRPDGDVLHFAVMRRLWPALLLLLAGCGPASDHRAAVRGRVTCNNLPVSHGVILFTPDAQRGNGAKTISSAKLSEDGRYELRREDGQALKPGWYRVTVARAPGAPSDGAKPAEKYRYPEQSGLQFEVGTKPEYEYDVPLDAADK